MLYMIIKDIYNFVFEEWFKKYYGIDKYYDNFNSDISKEYIKSILQFQWNIDWIYNYILINWFNQSIEQWKLKSSALYNKKIKLEETLPIYIQNYWLWKISYFQNITYSPRSKKNNRPIHINWDKMNTESISALKKWIDLFFNRSLEWKTRISWITKIIMSMVFIWKDEELTKHEELLKNYFQMYKNSQFTVVIKNFYEKKEIQKQLLKLFDNNMWIIKKFKENKSFMKIFLQLSDLIIDKYNLLDFNILTDSLELQENLYIYLQKTLLNNKYIIYKSDWKEYISSSLYDYMKNFMYYEEYLLSIIKKRKFWLNDCYDLNNFKEDELFILDIISNLDKKEQKLYIKRIFDWFNQKYYEYVLNSFLTQPDLSNSLELIQDVYQSFLQNISFNWDDIYITDIKAKMLRYKKDDKKDTLFKNINLFCLEKIK